MIMTKGRMITELKKAGIRRSPEEKKLESCKSYVIIKMYYDMLEGDKANV